MRVRRCPGCKRSHHQVSVDLKLDGGRCSALPCWECKAKAHLELAVVPLEVLARGSGLILAEGRAVHVVRVCLVGGAIPDQGGHLHSAHLAQLLAFPLVCL